MSIAQQWLAMALVGFAGTLEPKSDGPEIAYQFQVIEVHGLQWREAAGHGLKSVASHGGVSVWTAPRDYFKNLPQGTTKEVLTDAQGRRVLSGSCPHHCSQQPSVRDPGPLARRGATPRHTTEYVREGITATFAGRSIDQGILAQLVIEDTDVHSVHTLSVPAPATASVSNAGPITRNARRHLLSSTSLPMSRSSASTSRSRPPRSSISRCASTMS